MFGRNQIKSVIAVFALLLPMFVSCAEARKRIWPIILNQQSSSLTDEELELIGNLCPFGMPAREAAWPHGPTRVVARQGYALEHSSLDKVSLWVCEHLHDGHLIGQTQRRGWRADPKLNPGERAEDSDYTGSGYDRGHNAPRADYQYSQERVDDTFYLSNAAPQMGRNFNQSVWRVLEERVRGCVRAHEHAYVITGVFFYDPQEEGPATADGLINYYVIGANEVAVPTHFYKVVLLPEANDHWKAVAIVMENKSYPRRADHEYDFEPYVRSIDWLEERTGLNFMPDLDDENPDLAAQLEGSLPAATWSCLE